MRIETFGTPDDSPRRRLQQGYSKLGMEHFGDELIAVGREVGGADLDREAAFSLAVAGACHCGGCRGYSHCNYHAPRHLGDVLANVFKTGAKSGELVAFASQAFREHCPSDVVLDLGMGAGSCTSGWELGRGGVDIGPRLGVEVEPQASRLAGAVHETLQLASDIGGIEIPATGALVVLSGLVSNVVGSSVMDSWATAVANSRDAFLWVDVFYEAAFGRRNSRPDRLLRELGFVAELVFADSTPGFGAGSYKCEAQFWSR